MHRAAWVGIVAAGLAGIGGCTLVEARLPRGPAPVQAESGGPQMRELARLVNRHRETVGCPPLAWDEDLARVASEHSVDMESRGYFGHQSPEGEGVDGRLARAGLRWQRTLGENLAQTYRGPADVIRLWVTSPAHRANLENCAFRFQGLGHAGDLWTQVLAGGVERR